MRITGIMPDEPCPLSIGATGTVIRTTYGAISQIDVSWDDGRNLMLIPEDPFEIISTTADAAHSDGVAEPDVGQAR
ncbi:hypothetical protein [Nocardia sp. NPDC047038]|uniref:DUF4314 domain-containing protein n=1 Tax=Nocardia sp. NPDC047038 TaxID=3154338 RepID=UPI0033E346B0